MKLFFLQLLLLLGFNLSAQEGIVVDAKHNLEWQDHSEHKELIWKLARGYCTQLNLGGFHDWRMPTKQEFLAFAKNKNLTKKFVHLEDGLYWTATTAKKDDLSAHTVYSTNGYDSISDKCDKYFVICVRENTKNK